MHVAPSKIGRTFRVGDLYCFRTEPLSVFSPQVTGRFGALKVLAVDKKRVVLTVLAGAFPAPPSDVIASALNMIVVNEYDWSRRYATFAVSLSEDNSLQSFALLGNVPVSAAEVESANGCTGWTTWLTASAIIENWWRSQHDADALNAEFESGRRAADSRPSARVRLTRGDWTFTERRPFSEWEGYSHLPVDFVAGARAEIIRATAVMKNLGGHASEADVRMELEAVVLWFNQADERANGVIETEEHEDILMMLADIADAAGHPEAFDTACSGVAW